MTIVELLKNLPPDQAKGLLQTLSYRERELVKLRTGIGDDGCSLAGARVIRQL